VTAHYSEIVVFPDAALEAVVRSAIGKPDGNIHVEDVAPLTELSAWSAGISDLTGLDYCVNLAALDLTMNNITDLSPLYGLTCLENLRLGWNPVAGVQPLAPRPSPSPCVPPPRVLSSIRAGLWRAGLCCTMARATTPSTGRPSRRGSTSR